MGKNLKKTVKNVLERATDSLGGRKINITLISGGSANIKWLEKLLIRDFSEQLSEADPVPISHSFQEVVANGLAIECARRYYEPESEFVAVTYNPVKLYLDPDGTGAGSSQRYRSIGDKIDMRQAKDFDLIPAAQSLKHFFDVPLLWRTRLPKSPRRYLDYYFSRPENDDHKDCYNVESTRVVTRPNPQFDSHVKVELTVREDGTASPKFIYQSGSEEYNIPENSEKGKPFYLDMTSDSESISEASGYIGLDFGTSSSSVCRLTNETIKVTAQRERDKAWRSLSDSISTLPYPVAVTLRSFLQSKAEARDSCALARECFECCLTYMAFVALAEVGSQRDSRGLVKAFQHRSMGPLRALLVGALGKLKENAVFSTGFLRLLIPGNLDKIDLAIKEFTDNKHDKKDESFDYQGHLNFIVSIIHSGCDDIAFGYSATHTVPDFSEFKFVGKFMVAHDNYPYLENFSYGCNDTIKPNDALLVSRQTGDFLILTPLIFWWETEDQNMSKKCFWLDRPRQKESEALVKMCGSKSARSAKELHQGLEAVIDSLSENASVSFRRGRLKIIHAEDQ